jgi:thiamine pyrophosphokinase
LLFQALNGVLSKAKREVEGKTLEGLPMPRAILFANGDLPDPDLARQLIQPGDILIAADGGARHAASLGVVPSLIIGDFDSLSASELERFASAGATLERHPPAKDETDLELALDHAIRAGYSPILVLGAYGGRLDHSLGIFSLLSAPECITANVRADDGTTEAFFISTQAEIDGTAGDTVSLIAWGQPAEAVTTDGLEYPLNAETLSQFRTRGISNRMSAAQAKVSILSGLLLCVHIRQE